MVKKYENEMDQHKPNSENKKIGLFWGNWVAQSVKCLTLDLSSGLDLRVVNLSPPTGSMLGVKPTKIN